MDLLAREKEIRLKLKEVVKKLVPEISYARLNDISEDFMHDSGVIDLLNTACDNELKANWIPCVVKLPDESQENPITKDYYKYPCIYKNGIVLDVRYFSFGLGHWLHGGDVMDEYVIAWFDIYNTIPEQYKIVS